MSAAIRIYVVTFRRPILLRRALKSLIAQTFRDWVAEVVNDDPADTQPSAIIAEFHDPRIQLSTSTVKRGGTGNFNYAFRSVQEPFASILEDDNWWEPSFLERMQAELLAHSNVSFACANECIWEETAQGVWSNTSQTIWPASDSVRLAPRSIEAALQRPLLCNSALLFRTQKSEAWQTPASIPIDVTEHFRERVVPHPLLLLHQPLVNYGKTLSSHRQKGNAIWGQYSVLIIGSVFTNLAPHLHTELAQQTLKRVRGLSKWEITAFLSAGLFIPEARALWRMATKREKIRHVFTLARHPVLSAALSRARQDHAAAWAFLKQGDFANYAKNLTALQA
ncbi:MAG: glycosyltransferase [Verrucomicrobia bacterium]|nr:glycosyltransferase [Verrucomicrobiota bacterium]